MRKITELCISLIIILVVTIVISFVSCGISDSSKAKDINNKISLTITPNREPEDLYFESNSCILEENNKKLNIVATIKSNAAYSLTYSDVDDNKVYYTSNTEKDRSGGDQLFYYDLNTKTNKQLTDNFYAINYIIPMNNNNLFLIGEKEGAHNISLGYYDSNANKFVDLEWDNELFVSAANKDLTTGMIYISGYTNPEEDKIRDPYNNDKLDESCGVDNRIYSISGNDHKLIYESKNRHIESFAVNGDTLICNTTLEGENNSSEPEVIVYNIKTKKEVIIDNINLHGKIFRLDYNGENVYVNTGEEINKINVYTQKKETLYFLESGTAWINNAQ